MQEGLAFDIVFHSTLGLCVGWYGQRRSSIVLQSARDCVATAAETDRVTAVERHVRKTA